MSQIVVDNVTVRYDVHEYRSNTFKEFVMNRLSGKGAKKELIALHEVSFSVAKGESVALIGHNGSGKSTLLKVIAGIISPNNGKATVVGRIAPMIELGAGFDQELSGSENVFLSCMLLGLNRHEIAERYTSIVRFAELESFMHLPVKNYSSGMQARLGFACATAVEPSVLLVDEVLSVGDANFARKCLNRVVELKKKGTTVVLVSHDENTVRSFCQRALVFDQGKMLFDGNAPEALAIHHEILDQRYLDSMHADQRLEELRKIALAANAKMLKTEGSREIAIVTAQVHVRVVQRGAAVEKLLVTEPFQLEISIDVPRHDLIRGGVNVGFGFNSIDGRRLMGRNLRQMKRTLPEANTFAQSSHLSIFSFPKGLPFLSSGAVNLMLGVLDSEDTRPLCNLPGLQILTHNPHSPENFDNDVIACEKWIE